MPKIKNQQAALRKWGSIEVALEKRISEYQELIQEQQNRQERLFAILENYPNIKNRNNVNYAKKLPPVDLIGQRENWIYDAHLQISRMIDEDWDIDEIVDTLNLLRMEIIRYSQDVEGWLKYAKSFLSKVSQNIVQSYAKKFMLPQDSRFPVELNTDFKAYSFSKNVSDFIEWLKKPENQVSDS